MEEVEKIKNVLDLQHQKTINSFNIIIITLISSYITIILGTLDFWKTKTMALISITSLVAFSIVFIWLFFEYKLQKIKTKIELL